MNPTELIASLPPELLKKLEKIASEAERGKVLDTQLAGLSIETDEKIKATRQAYIEKHAAKFADFNWKSALIGSPSAECKFTYSGMSFYVRPPLGGGNRAIQRMAQDKELAALLPINQEEFTVLGWLTAVQLEGKARIDMTVHGEYPARLAMLRSNLTDIILNKLAADCNTLETWMNVQLELDGGKF